LVVALVVLTVVVLDLQEKMVDLVAAVEQLQVVDLLVVLQFILAHHL